MTDSRIRIDFYVLPATDVGARLHFTCRLTEKVYGMQHRIHAHMGSSGQARELDELLWTFRQGSFLPHSLSVSATDALAPITIGYDEPADVSGDLLINLCRCDPAVSLIASPALQRSLTARRSPGAWAVKDSAFTGITATNQTPIK